MHSEPFLKPRSIGNNIDPLDIGARVDELKLLRDGWLDGKGRAPTHADLDWLVNMLGSHFSDDTPLPYLYPTIEGDVRAEWPIKPYELSIHIDLEHRVGEWHSLNMDTDEEQFKKLDLKEPRDWEWLSKELRQLAGV